MRCPLQLANAYLLSAKNANRNNARTAVDNAEARLGDAIKFDPSSNQQIILFAKTQDPQRPAGARRTIARFDKGTCTSLLRRIISWQQLIY